MGAQKSQPLWVDPDRVPPPTSVLYEQAEPEVLFNSNGVPVYPEQSTTCTPPSGPGKCSLVSTIPPIVYSSLFAEGLFFSLEG